MTDLDLGLHIVLTDQISGLQYRYPPAEWIGNSHGAMLVAPGQRWRMPGGWPGLPPPLLWPTRSRPTPRRPQR
jgi:hypothetical protein